MIKTITKKKKCKKAKCLSEEALQIAEKRKEAKGKGENERYTHLNAEFQGIARRDKKAFLSDQYKEIKENNRMGKTRGLFKNIRNNGNISCKAKVKITLLCPSLCSPTAYTVYGILQARILEWVAYPFSSGSSPPRNQTGVACIAGGFFTN